MGLLAAFGCEPNGYVASPADWSEACLEEPVAAIVEWPVHLDEGVVSAGFVLDLEIG